MKFKFLAIFVCCHACVMFAQTPSDNQMMEKGEFCGAVIYSHDQWDHYWEGTLKRTNGNIGTVTRQMSMPMFALGLTSRINVLAALPYVSCRPSAGQFIGQSGLQDLGLWVKADVHTFRFSKSSLQLFAVLGGSTPLTDYNKDFLPFSVGLGAREASLRGIVQYQTGFGPYARAYFAYHLRDNIRLDRDFYYTDRPVYSRIVDMPDMISYGVHAGWWFLNDALDVNVSCEGMITQGGFDIRRQDMPLASNRMNALRAGMFAHYYAPWFPGFSIIGAFQQVAGGRNVGQSTAVSAGLAYQFGMWGNKPVNAEKSK